MRQLVLRLRQENSAPEGRRTVAQGEALRTLGREFGTRGPPTVEAISWPDRIEKSKELILPEIRLDVITPPALGRACRFHDL